MFHSIGLFQHISENFVLKNMSPVCQIEGNIFWLSGQQGQLLH
jgi:hypothetical protein